MEERLVRWEGVEGTVRVVEGGEGEEKKEKEKVRGDEGWREATVNALYSIAQ